MPRTKDALLTLLGQVTLSAYRAIKIAGLFPPAIEIAPYAVA